MLNLHKRQSLISNIASMANYILATYDAYNNIQKTGLTYQNGKLVSVNGKSIVYDALGNPTTYKNNTFTWEQGRKLVSGSMNNNTFTYAYDGNGMRYKKTVNGTQLLFFNAHRTCFC